jgi:hypothetical protein
LEIWKVLKKKIRFSWSVSKIRFFAVEVGTLKFSFAQVCARDNLCLGLFKTAIHKFPDPEFSIANPQFSKHVSPFFVDAAHDRLKDVGLAAVRTFDIAGQRRPSLAKGRKVTI